MTKGDNDELGYHAGEKVHWIQAKHALRDLPSAVRVTITQVAPDYFDLETDDGEILRRHNYRAGALEADLQRTSSRDGGYLALLHEGFHLLMVPVGEDGPPPAQMPVYWEVTRMEDGDSIESPAGDTGACWLLFSVTKEPSRQPH